MTDAHDVSTGMTIKDMVSELYNDMKVVRPAVENYLAANLPGRVLALENQTLTRNAAAIERGRIAGITNRAIGIIILVTNFALGILVLIRH